MTSRNKKAMILAIIAGILLLIAGINGIATWETIKDFVINYIGENEIIEIIFVILILIASLGGFAVIIGGLLFGKDKVRTGRFLIALGAGLGLIGLIVSIVITIYEESPIIGSFFSIGSIGLIMSIIARIIAKKE